MVALFEPNSSEVCDGKRPRSYINVKMSLQLVNRSTMVRSCSDDCWDEFIGFWIEGCLVPVIAAFGIVGGWWSLLLSSIKTRKPTHKCASCTCITCITTRCQILCSMRLQCVSKILTPRRMLKKSSLIAKINRWNNSFQNKYNMLKAKVDRLAGKTYFVKRKHLKTPKIMDNFSYRLTLEGAGG